MYYRKRDIYIMCKHEKYFTIVPNLFIDDIMEDDKYQKYIIPRVNNIFYMYDFCYSSIKLFEFMFKVKYLKILKFGIEGFKWFTYLT